VSGSLNQRSGEVFIDLRAPNTIYQMVAAPDVACLDDSAHIKRIAVAASMVGVGSQDEDVEVRRPFKVSKPNGRADDASSGTSPTSHSQTAILSRS
jgi:hypothetical protein